MKIVILVSGPRGSGKSTYVDNIKKDYPETLLISRDKILIELFGTTVLSPYSGGHEYAREIVYKKIEKALTENNEKVKIIFDYWNGSSSERRIIIRRIRSYGADKIICWHFITELHIVNKWFYQKPDTQGYSDYAATHDYKLYHKQAKNIQDDGFDSVVLINPRQLTFPGFPLI